MPVIAKPYPKGSKHPPFATGIYTYSDPVDHYKESITSTLKRYNNAYPTEEKWRATYSHLNGYILEDNAVIYMWEDAENEFGIISP